MKCFLNTGRNKAELLTLILEHFSAVFKLLYKTLETQWLLPNLIKFNKKLVAVFVKVFFLGYKLHKVSLPCILPFKKQGHGQKTLSEESF